MLLWGRTPYLTIGPRWLVVVFGRAPLAHGAVTSCRLTLSLVAFVPPPSSHSYAALQLVVARRPLAWPSLACCRFGCVLALALPPRLGALPLCLGLLEFIYL